MGGQFNLADDSRTLLQGLLNRFGGQIHSWTHHDQILPEKGFFSVATPFHWNRQFLHG